MNPEHDPQWELEIDRTLKSLPELNAPQTLRARVLAAIAQRRSVPWYNQPWQSWPLVLRIAALAMLLAMFGGLCVASWQLTRAAGVSVAAQEVAGLFSGLSAVWNTLNVLFGAMVVVFKHLGTGFMIACALIVGLGYTICVGLGTACIRLAFVRR